MDKRWVSVVQAVVDRTRDYPKDAYDDLFLALDRIERKYNLIEPLTVEEREAIEEGRRSIERGDDVPMEDIVKLLGIETYDRNAAGKEDLEEVLARINKLSGEDQGAIADVLLALIQED